MALRSVLSAVHVPPYTQPLIWTSPPTERAFKTWWMHRDRNETLFPNWLAAGVRGHVLRVDSWKPFAPLIPSIWPPKVTFRHRPLEEGCLIAFLLRGGASHFTGDKLHWRFLSVGTFVLCVVMFCCGMSTRLCVCVCVCFNHSYGQGPLSRCWVAAVMLHWCWSQFWVTVSLQSKSQCTRPTVLAEAEDLIDQASPSSWSLISALVTKGRSFLRLFFHYRCTM